MSFSLSELKLIELNFLSCCTILCSSLRALKSITLDCTRVVRRERKRRKTSYILYLKLSAKDKGPHG